MSSVAGIASIAVAAKDVLIIPDILTSTVGMYDVATGEYLGDIVPDDGHLHEIHCAVMGPDNLIYVSDQIEGKVFRYDLDGEFVDVFVDVTLDGLNFPKGMDFLVDEEDGSHSLLVAALHDYVPGGPFIGRIAKYSEDGTYDADFLGARDFSSAVFDISVNDDNSIWYVLYGNGQVQFTDGGIGRLDPSGRDLGLVVSARGADQVIRCPSTGNLMTSVLAGYFYGEPHFHEFTPDGDVVASWNIPGPVPAPHGIEKLDNGMVLSVGDSGIWRVDPEDGYSTTLMRSGSGFRMVHRATLPGPCLGDLDGDGTVGVPDLVAVITAWGTPDGDVTDDGTTDVADLIAVITAWGACE
jgi:hypothetical protein